MLETMPVLCVPSFVSVSIVVYFLKHLISFSNKKIYKIFKHIYVKLLCNKFSLLEIKHKKIQKQV